MHIIPGINCNSGICFYKNGNAICLEAQIDVVIPISEVGQLTGGDCNRVRTPHPTGPCRPYDYLSLLSRAVATAPAFDIGVVRIKGEIFGITDGGPFRQWDHRHALSLVILTATAEQVPHNSYGYRGIVRVVPVLPDKKHGPQLKSFIGRGQHPNHSCRLPVFALLLIFFKRQVISSAISATYINELNP